jgi:phage terminase large subunit-like protein
MSLAFDRWRINDLKRELDAIGCQVPLEPHGQGYKDMSPAVDIVERLVVQRKLRHGAHPVLSWCAANAVVRGTSIRICGRNTGSIAASAGFGTAQRKRSGGSPISRVARSTWWT